MGGYFGSGGPSVPDFGLTGTVFTRAFAPGASDDDAAGYDVGDFWIDSSASPNEGYKCLVNSTGAAVWAEVTNLDEITAHIADTANPHSVDVDDLADMEGDLGAGGAHGLVPAQAIGDGAKVLRGDGTWVAVAGGDMLKATYDPTTVNGDAFDADNHVYNPAVSGLVATNVQAAIDEIDADVDALETDQHTHANKTELDLVSDGDHDVRSDNPHGITPSQISAYTKTEVDALVDGTLKAFEAYDPAGSGNFPTTYGGEAVQKGDAFKIVTADTLGTGTIVNIDDSLYALIDTPGQTDANWLVAESNRDQASETVKGVAEIATQAETDAGTDDDRIVTPLKLKNLPANEQATETIKGVAELATQAETDTGTDDLRTVTPLKLANLPANNQASETVKGVAELATQGETDTGTDDLRIVTPLKLANLPANKQATETVKGVAEIATDAEVATGTDDLRFITPLKLATAAFLRNLIEDTTPELGGVLVTNAKQVRLSKGADIPSGAALAPGSDGNAFDVTGTTTITSINSLGVGTRILLHFDGILILTHHATNLILPTGANITTAAGDIAEFYEYAAGDWRCSAYTRADGTALAGAGGGLDNVVEDLTPQSGGTFDMNSKQMRWSKGSDVASAAALTLGTDGNLFDITGTTTITSIATLAPGSVVILHFDAALTLTHHATDLILPGEADILTEAGDIGVFYEYATGDWRCISWERFSGASLVNFNVFPHDTMPNIGGNQNNYGPTGFAEAQVVRLNPTIDVQITGFVAPSPVRGDSAANRVLASGNKDVEANEAVLIWYDTTSSRWRILSSAIF
jgi:hypothetical protein